MNLRYVALCGLACAVLLLTGCDQGRQSPGKAGVRVLNVAPGFELLAFRREQETSNEAVVTFKGAQEFVYDADSYDFYVTERTLTANNPRVWTFAPTLEADLAYTFVLTEVGGEIQPVVISHPDPPAADAQIVALHAASGLPALDLYLERPGVGIAGATPRGSFGAQEQIARRTLASGDYELTLTAAGDPANVLLTTTTITLLAGTESTFVVAPEGGQGTAQLSVLLLQGVTSILYDRNATSELRYVNAATDQAPRDVAIDSQFSPPLFSAVPFGESTPYAPYPTVAAKINVTPVGNPGALEFDRTLTGAAPQRATLLFAGPAGTLTSAFSIDDGRRLNLEAKLRFMSGVSQFFAVDFVITFPDGDPNVVLPQASLAAPGVFSSYTPLAPGDYDLYLYQAGTLTPAFSVDDTRRLNVEAKLRFMNAVSQFFAVDFVVTVPGGNPFQLLAQASLAAPGIASSYLPLAPGEYDLYLFQASTATQLSGPTRFSVAAGGIYSVLAVDGPDTATAAVRFLDDFP